MGYAMILGLDLGKFKSVCCVMDALTGRHAFETLASTPAAIADLLTCHAGAGNGQEVLLVIETCDAAGWVHDVACATAAVAVTVVHTQGDERWRWCKVKRKTDRDDALEARPPGAAWRTAPASGARALAPAPPVAQAHHPPPQRRQPPHAQPQRHPLDLPAARPQPGARQQAVDARGDRAARARRTPDRRLHDR